ncbi:MAG: primosomal protein N' [Desulfobacterota bacterium]|nr:primosomal protein N' [Thermodesulfobacteriota bacterium]
MSFFQVVIPPLDQPYTYRVPPELACPPRVGQRVLVPLRRKSVTGYLWEPATATDPGLEIRAVEQILDPDPLFSESLRAIILWTARYYHYPLGRVLQTALPPGLTVSRREFWRITPLGVEALDPDSGSPEQTDLLHFLTSGQGWPDSGLPFPQEKLAALEACGLIGRQEEIQKEKARPKKIRMVYPGPGFKAEAFSAQDQTLINLLEKQGPLSLPDLRRSCTLSAGRLAALCRQGLLEVREETFFRNPLGEILTAEPLPIRLTEDQERALAKIHRRLADGRYQTLLLHGVTGSGKTEIYLQAAQKALQQERQVLILVPEIGLIPQMEGRVRFRFGEKVAVLHSSLSPGERLDQWRRIQSGAAPIVVGTRSAVFAPLEKLGLLVVDEEHDPSLKQQESLRYQARDLALVRARLASAVALLGSATPSLTTLNLWERQKISYLSLPRRIRQTRLPAVTVVDLKDRGRGRSGTLLSPVLLETMTNHLREGGQVLLFLNRRGYEPLTICTLCGAPVRCRNCAVSLTYHAASDALLCHLCGYRQPLSRKCPSCSGDGIKTLGWGTEKVEAGLRTLYPDAAIDRLDRDAVTRKNAHFQVLKRFRDRKTRILIGTQMITKGHDFPGVSLIGVLCADLSLNWPDFRAGERTMQLLMQVAGRTGRGSHPGQVLIQTFNPDHILFDYIRRHDYLGFYRQEIGLRRQFNYPPFSRLILLIFQGNSAERVKRASAVLGELLGRESLARSWDKGLEIMGPVPAPISRIKGRHRWQILLKGRDPGTLHQAAVWVQEKGQQELKGRGVRMIVDVDPGDML